MTYYISNILTQGKGICHEICIYEFLLFVFKDILYITYFDIDQMYMYLKKLLWFLMIRMQHIIYSVFDMSDFTQGWKVLS